MKQDAVGPSGHELVILANGDLKREQPPQGRYGPQTQHCAAYCCCARYDFECGPRSSCWAVGCEAKPPAKRNEPTDCNPEVEVKRGFPPFVSDEIFGPATVAVEKTQCGERCGYTSEELFRRYEKRERHFKVAMAADGEKRRVRKVLICCQDVMLGTVSSKCGRIICNFSVGATVVGVRTLDGCCYSICHSRR
jgi:hypothetical protein